VRRLVAFVVAMMLGVAALVGGSPVAAQAVTKRVKPEFFGMHDPFMNAPLHYGAVRLWDDRTTWADLEKSKGHYGFAALDAAVADAGAKHAKITLVLGSTPAWAALNPKQRSAGWIGPGSSSPPRHQVDWTNYVTKVVARYKGRIDSYQIWNEPQLPQFWSSTPAKLAQLTAAARAAVKKADPKALVVATPMLPRQPRWRSWSTAYLTALRDLGWPVDVFAIHSYTRDRLANPDGRAAVIKSTKDLLRSVRAPSRPLWDTEANYTSRRYFMQQKKITGPRAAAWVARAYLDSLRLNVSRTFWYGYNQPVGWLGVTVGTGTAAADGYASVLSWLVGSTFKGCTSSRAATGVTVTRCSFLRGTKASRVVWASAKRHTPLGGKGTTICRLLNGCSARTKQTMITKTPVLVR
jgi:polysaccharide biosynthesis protein PslG